MVVSAYAMRMAVREFLRRGFANAHDLNVKMELCACERVIEVEGHIIAIDVRDHGNSMALACVYLHLHAHLKLFTVTALKAAERHEVYHLLIVLTIGISRGDDSFHLVTGRFPFQFAFQAGNEVSNTLNVGQRVAALA